MEISYLESFVRRGSTVITITFLKIALFRNLQTLEKKFKHENYQEKDVVFKYLVLFVKLCGLVRLIFENIQKNVKKIKKTAKFLKI